MLLRKKKIILCSVFLPLCWANPANLEKHKWCFNKLFIVLKIEILKGSCMKEVTYCACR